MIDQHHGWNFSFKPLVLGFVLSILLIYASYQIVARHHLSSSMLYLTLLGLAMIQALVQLVFFLQLGLESKPHWNVITFLFMLLVLAIIIAGSLWIMNNLNYNVMPSMEH